MSTVASLLNIKKAISNLNPEQVRQLSERRPRIALCAATPEGFGRLERFLLGEMSEARRRESAALLVREQVYPRGQYDLVIYDEAISAPAGSLVFHPDRRQQFVVHVLDSYPDFGVALARAFTPFRKPFASRMISRTCKENTLFSLATALPDVIPSVIELPWALAEFASDTAFLTMNQLKMAFLLAAASDRRVGYREQKSEVASVVAGAFGWRAIARQLVGKVPFGGGLIAKAAIAYAGTKVVGISLDHLYSVGYTYSRSERETLYADALKQGRQVAGNILRHIRPDLAAKYASEAVKRIPMVYPRGDTH
ncbi:MAG: hypothetical protein JO061_18960 [Acidobacteriaceae bacterium]|nr:hypothetical protein [Acidobacteriaceae bacterium]